MGRMEREALAKLFKQAQPSNPTYGIMYGTANEILEKALTRLEKIDGMKKELQQHIEWMFKDEVDGIKLYEDNDVFVRFLITLTGILKEKL